MSLKAKKENKIYQVTEQQKDRYLNEGFDIYKDDVLVEHSPLKKIKYSDHVEALAEKDKVIVELHKALDEKDKGKKDDKKEPIKEESQKGGK